MYIDYTKPLADALLGKSATANNYGKPAIVGGWEGRSGSSPFKRYVIFEVGGIAEAAAFRSWACGPEALAGNFKSLQGSWYGRHQPSFICEDTNANRALLKPWLAGQEAVLCIGPAYRPNDKGLMQLMGHREAVRDWLEPDGYTVNRREVIGLFQAVSKAEALTHEGWTFDPLELQYYTVL